MHRYRPANHFFMAFALPIGPGLFDGDLFGKGSLGQIRRQLPDTRCRNTNSIRHCFRRIGIIKIGLGHQHKGRHRNTAIGQLDLALQMTFRASRIMRYSLAGGAVDHLRLAISIAQEQPVIRLAGVANDQPGCIRITAEIININIAGQHQFADQ